jgi:CTP:molybdopterin cytidylyltransferase MocA
VTGVCAVVLAAGEASRFGSPKQRLLLPAVLQRLAAAPLDEIVVVEGAHPLDGACDTVSLAVPVRVVRCADWEQGPGASLRCGLAALGPDCEAAVVVLADGPRLSPDAVARVVESSPPARRGTQSPTRACARSSRDSSPATTWAARATSTRRRICPSGD